MKRDKVNRPQPARPGSNLRTSTMPVLPAGMKVRSDVRSGAWNCTSCQGEVMGDQLFRPTCSFCQAS